MQDSDELAVWVAEEAAERKAARTSETIPVPAPSTYKSNRQSQLKAPRLVNKKRTENRERIRWCT